MDLVSVGATVKCGNIVRVEVKNQGPNAMPAAIVVTVEVTLERGSPTYSAAVSETIKLASGATVGFTLALPVALDGCAGGPGGPEQGTVEMDSLNAVQESNEANNTVKYTLG